MNCFICLEICRGRICTICRTYCHRQCYKNYILVCGIPTSCPVCKTPIKKPRTRSQTQHARWCNIKKQLIRYLDDVKTTNDEERKRAKVSKMFDLLLNNIWMLYRPKFRDIVFRKLREFTTVWINAHHYMCLFNLKLASGKTIYVS